MAIYDMIRYIAICDMNTQRKVLYWGQIHKTPWPQRGIPLKPFELSIFSLKVNLILIDMINLQI